MTDSTPIRTIRRYANRKLYDVQESRYVTLDEIADLVRKGEEIRVEDKATGEDLTARTLTHILHLQERRQAGGPPSRLLKQVIQSGGDLLQRHVTEPVIRVREEAERTVATVRDDMARGVDRLRRREREGTEAFRAGVRELLETSQARLDAVQARFDEKVRLLVAALPLIHAQRDELLALEERVEALEAQLALEAADPAPSDPEKDK